MIMISVIIPNYKADNEAFLAGINSIINEGYCGAFEILIIDDGNSLEYRERVYSLPVFKDSRINVFFQENQGVSSARNLGISKAVGKYITFVDADDFVIGNFLAESITIATKNNADVVIGALINPQYYDQNVKDNENLDEFIYSEKEKNNVKRLLIGKHYYIGNTKAYIGRGPVAKIVRSEIAKQIPFDSSLRIYEDTVWYLDVIDISKKICRVDRVWYGYNYFGSSASKGFHVDEIERSTKGMLEIYKRLDLENSEIRNAFCEQCMIEYDRIMISYFLNTNNNNSRIAKISQSFEMIHSIPWNYPLYAKLIGLDKHTYIKKILYKYNLWLPIKMLIVTILNPLRQHSFTK